MQAGMLKIFSYLLLAGIVMVLVASLVGNPVRTNSNRAISVSYHHIGFSISPTAYNEYHLHDMADVHPYGYHYHFLHLDFEWFPANSAPLQIEP